MKKRIYKIDELKQKSEMFSVNKILKHNAYQNKPLDFESAYTLGIYTLYPYKKCLKGVFKEKPSLAEKQSIAALCALHNQETYKQKGAAEQIAGIVAAIFDYDIGCSDKGFLNPNVEYAMDNCGMGGDLYRTPNVSTTAAIIAATDKIPMCKHGSPGNTDSTGSSDFLEFCGVKLFSGKKTVEKELEKNYFAYTDALDTGYKSIHVQTHISAALAHMNDIIGPITNPLNPKLMKKRVLGVNHLIEPKTVAEAYKILNERGVTDLKHGLFVRGFVTKNREGGIDEVSTFEGGTKVAELKEGKISEYDLYAEDFGIPIGTYFEPPRGKEGKAQFSKDIFEGKIKNSFTDLVLANAAILEYLGKGLSFKEGFKKAKEIMESGKPIKTLEAYAAISSKRGKK